MDNNIDDDRIAGLRRLGIDIVRTRDDLGARTEDESLLERSTALGRMFCTEDKDFLRITSRWWLLGCDFAGLIRIQQHDSPLGLLVEDVALIALTHTADEVRNRVFHVPIRS